VTRPVIIGNTQGFWGDRIGAPAQMVAQAPHLDYLTLDYLAEVSLSIMASQRERDPAAGFAADFLHVIRALAPTWRAGARYRLITNAGGLNPKMCARQCATILDQAGCRSMKIAVVGGDDVLPLIRSQCQAGTPSRTFDHLETGQPISEILGRLVTANVYLGARPIVEALEQGADIVITGRVADPSLTVAPCVYHFGWSWDNYDCLAGATVAGHLIECGAQVTGGISTEWMDMPDIANIGYPLVEVSQDGSSIVTKPPGTGGRVDVHTVKEQLLYEIGDPDNYLSPDVTVSFLGLDVHEQATDRVRVRGARGRQPPSTYKVSATYRSGFRAQGQLAVFGRDAVAKARRAGQIVLARVREAGYELEQTVIECLGAGDCVPGVVDSAAADQSLETVLRIAVADPRREAVERFAQELAPLVTSGPQGITGYAEGRPRVRPVFGYWPCLIEQTEIRPTIELITGR
jgi:hypothetical protein